MQTPRLWTWLVASFLLTVIVGTLGPLPKWILLATHSHFGDLTLVNQLRAEQSIRTILLQAVGGILLVFGAVATWRQVATARDQLRLNQSIRTTDVFSKAVEQLGDQDALSTRVGGIYALSNLADDQKSSFPAVALVLSTFIRQADGRRPLDAAGVDRQAAIDVLVSKYSTVRISLRSANLRGIAIRDANLNGWDLHGAILVDADLRRSTLSNVDLTHADLTQADLRGADFSRSDLDGAVYDGAHQDTATKLPIPRH